ncbi:chorismate-binding protein [Robiginitalea biformata]|uniref:chorismate-binding protein n=1 Tax=Robiginitalea biformata TaxID=252307 RepID=UPI003B5AD3B8
MPSPKKTKFSKLERLLGEHRGKSLPFALFRNPGEEEIHSLLQNDRENPGFTGGNQKGFVFAPFHAGASPTLFLRPDQAYRTPVPGGAACAMDIGPRPDTEAREIHMGLVEEAVREIRTTSLEKVVLARRFSLPCTLSAVEIFLRLCQTYPRAFCYVWSHPDSGTWLGASPEQLMEFDGTRGHTDALAGTQPAAGFVAPAWSAKEYREQQLVTDFIVEKLREAGLEPEVGPTRDERAGALWHLRTRVGFQADADAAAGLVGALHPTPAVCGQPRGAARDYILGHENFDREYYCGFLGEVGRTGPGSFRLFVNLRCLQLRENSAYIYTGGGITADSDPAAEWDEIQHKSLTVLRALQNSPD